MSYEVTLENIEQTYDELEPLYRQHYGEMVDRMSQVGVELSPFNPRKDEYFKAGNLGYLLTFVLRYKDKAVGYANMYLTHDMHNQDFISTEDTIYVVPEHRGHGRQLSRKVHDELEKREVKRLAVITSTNLRVKTWLERQGYVHTAHHMTKTF